MGGVLIFQLSFICTLKAIEVIKKVKKRKKRLVDWAKAFKHTVRGAISISDFYLFFLLDAVQLLFIQCQGSRRWQNSMIFLNQTKFGLEFSWGWQWSSIFSKPIWIWFGICVLQNSIFSFQTKLELVWKIRRIFWVYLFQTKLDLVWKRTLNEI